MLSNRERPSTCNSLYKRHPKQAAAFILPVAVSLFLPLTGHKTGFYRSRTWPVSKCLLNNNIDTKHQLMHCATNTVPAEEK